MLAGSVLLVLASGNTLGRFQSYTGCHPYSQHSPGRGDALESPSCSQGELHSALVVCWPLLPKPATLTAQLMEWWQLCLCSNPSARWEALDAFQGKQSTAKPWTLPVWCRTEMVKGRQMGYEGEAALSPKLDLWWLWVLLTPSVAEQGSGRLLERGGMLSSKLYKYVETLNLNMPKVYKEYLYEECIFTVLL